MHYSTLKYCWKNSVSAYQYAYVTFPLRLHNQLLAFPFKMARCLHRSSLTHCTGKNSWQVPATPAEPAPGLPPAGHNRSQLAPQPPNGPTPHPQLRPPGSAWRLRRSSCGKESLRGEEQLPEKGWRGAAEGGRPRTDKTPAQGKRDTEARGARAGGTLERGGT